ncbi:RNA polymerase sigma factor (sigma-70 family) [Curtobacterium pusillum]|uniref:RNA polymerase sigma factor (Sigma-70 family) n=1 Tax=Curtobacterium pusillum TaxID=69373 RepID=A0AAW3T9G4_9MICO|nr:sigma-70 family RNA polymerase sigma factor [Curtobacterium pusillum]MBA8990858.1 RNA polymerase sigma factor (sigma-70 family) [Curtobacterium pusillum]
MEWRARADDDLLHLARAGQPEAFAEIWRRHAPRVRSLVARLTAHDVDDVTAETFFRIYRAIRAGHGPRESFIAYAATTVRHIGEEWSRAKRPVELDEHVERVISVAADIGAEAHRDDLDLAMAAFRRLPDRWRDVLWATEVEGASLAEVGARLGLAPNAVAALAVRARDGLRTAWVDSHIRADRAEGEHLWAVENLARYVRGKLRGRQLDRMAEHLDRCGQCPVMLDAAREAARRLAADGRHDAVGWDG